MLPKKKNKSKKKPMVDEKVVLVSHEVGEVRVAVVENGILEEFYIERENARKIYGNVYKGVVNAVVPGINAVFVDIGTGKDGFLYLHDAESCVDGEDEEKPRRRNSRARAAVGSIDVKKGDEIAVQVTKEAIRNKGPRLTTKLSIPARYLVLTSDNTRLGISRRIADKAERERIREVISTVKHPDDIGFIVRTVAEGKEKKDFIRDVHYLSKVWRMVQQQIKAKKAPTLVLEELDLVKRIIRDSFTEDMTKVIVDSPSAMKKMQHFMQMYMPDYKAKIVLHKEKNPLFAKYNIENEIELMCEKNVSLPSGGHIVIEQTEGMIAIDVNSGKYKDKRDMEQTAFKTNVEAAREAVRQLRLRDVGGIVIIDFIDMNIDKNKREVMNVLKESVARDKAKINILKISEIGVVELTRQRMRDSVESSIYETCPYCNGRGAIKSLTTMRIQVLKDIRKKAAQVKDKQIFVAVHPALADELIQTGKEQITVIERMNKNQIIVVADPSMHREEVDISY